MSIERTNPLIPITAISQRNLNEGAQEARKTGNAQTKAMAGDTSVKLSEAQKN